jgi:hypothetical protein
MLINNAKILQQKEDLMRAPSEIGAFSALPPLDPL